MAEQTTRAAPQDPTLRHLPCYTPVEVHTASNGKAAVWLWCVTCEKPAHADQLTHAGPFWLAREVRHGDDAQ